jgi:hypothetical protein
MKKSEIKAQYMNSVFSSNASHVKDNKSANSSVVGKGQVNN